MLKTLKVIILLLISHVSLSQNVTWMLQPFRYQYRMVKTDSALILPALNQAYVSFSNRDSVGAIWYNTGLSKFQGKAGVTTKSFVLEDYSGFIQNQNTTNQVADFRIANSGSIMGNLGIGVTAPGSIKMNIVGAGVTQARMGYDGSNYCNFTVGSNGTMTEDLTGTNPKFVFGKGVNILGTNYVQDSLAVGIAVPTQKLDVNGNSRITGIETVGGLSAGAMFIQDTTLTTTATVTDTKTTFWVNNSGAMTVNLPTAVGRKSRIYIIKKVGNNANAVTIDPSGTQTIDGNLTVDLVTQYDFIVIQTDGTNWFQISPSL